jgi:hypothetical protein
MRGGERLATDKRQSWVYGAKMCSLYAALLSSNGEGEDAEGGLLSKRSEECRVPGCEFVARICRGPTLCGANLISWRLLCHPEFRAVQIEP